MFEDQGQKPRRRRGWETWGHRWERKEMGTVWVRQGPFQKRAKVGEQEAER